LTARREIGKNEQKTEAVNLMPQQLALFETENQSEVAAASIQVAAKSTVDKLLEIRRRLTPEQQFFLPQINHLIEQIRACARSADETKAENLILEAIEKKDAHTLSEITEDTLLCGEKVKEVLTDLHRRGTVKFYRRNRSGETLVFSTGQNQPMISASRIGSSK
jgi:predicted transcriptional regulator